MPSVVQGGPGGMLRDNGDNDDCDDVDSDNDVDRQSAHGGPGGVDAGRGAGGAGRHAEGSGPE